MTDTPEIVLIAAHDEERGIGKANRLPWRIPADLARFKALTMGHPVVMGRKTFESIGRPLPERTNIVVTRNPNFRAVGVTVVHSVDRAIDLARQFDQTVFIIGGAEIYRQALPKADRLELTLVDGTHHADAFFPPYEDFSVTAESSGEDGGHRYRFVTLERRGKSG